MDTNIFVEEQLPDLGNNHIAEEDNGKDVELDGIEIDTWKKKNKVYVLLQQHEIEGIHQYYDN